MPLQRVNTSLHLLPPDPDPEPAVTAERLLASAPYVMESIPGHSQAQKLLPYAMTDEAVTGPQTALEQSRIP